METLSIPYHQGRLGKVKFFFCFLLIILITNWQVFDQMCPRPSLYMKTYIKQGHNKYMWFLFPYLRTFNKGTFNRLKWSLVPPDFKECCIRYS